MEILIFHVSNGHHFFQICPYKQKKNNIRSRVLLRKQEIKKISKENWCEPKTNKLKILISQKMHMVTIPSQTRYLQTI